MQTQAFIYQALAYGKSRALYLAEVRISGSTSLFYLAGKRTAIRTTDSSNWKMMLKGVAANGIAQVLNGLINNAVVNNLY